MSYHLTAEQILNLDPHNYNQLMVDFLSRVHSRCMDTVLDNRAEYVVHDSIRDLVGRECLHSAVDSERWLAHVTRFDVPVPGRERVRRKLEQRKAMRLAHPVGSVVEIPTDPVLGNDPFFAKVLSYSGSSMEVEEVLPLDAKDEAWTGYVAHDLTPLQTNC